MAHADEFSDYFAKSAIAGGAASQPTGAFLLARGRIAMPAVKHSHADRGFENSGPSTWGIFHHSR